MELETLQCDDAPIGTMCCKQRDGDSGGVIASIQNGWVRKPLADVADVISGYAFKSSEFGDQGIPVIKIKNIRVGSVDISEADRVDEKYLEIPERYHVRAGDILISLTGSHISQPNSVVGRVARHSTCLPTCLLNQRAGKVMVRDRTTCDLGFLFYALSEPETMRAIAMLAHGAASQANVSPSQVESIEIPFPPLPVQRQIAGILSAYDELIENSQRRIRILEEMARTLYREWFVHFRFPGHENHPLVPSSLGVIPQGWEVKKLGDIAESMRRNVPKGKLEEPKPYIGLEHIPRRSLALNVWEMATELGSNKLEFKKGEVLFGKIRPYFHKVSVAPFDGLCSADTIVIRACLPEHYAVVAACVSSDAFVALASATANGAKMPRANWDVLEKYQIVIPKGNVAEKFSALFADIIAQQQTLIFKIQNLRQTRDLLLPRLLTGEVNIEEQ